MKKLLLLFAICFVFAIPKSYAGDTSVSEILTDEGFLSALTWTDLAAQSSTTFTGTAGLAITTATLVSGGTTLVDGASYSQGINTFLQIAFPRNIVCDVGFLVGEGTTTVSGTLTISGKNARNTQTTEALAVTTNVVTGAEAWAFIDTFTLSGFAISGACGTDVSGTNAISSCSIHIGIGNKIGFGVDIRTSTDVYKYTVDNVDLSSTSYELDGANETFDTMNLAKSLISNGSRDYRIWLKALKNH
jgi:hypothetical protein